MPHGSTAYSNSLLAEGSYRFKNHSLKDHLVQLLEFSKDINFFGSNGTATNRWYDLLKQSTIFQLARFQGVDGKKLFSFFQDLDLRNGFTADATLSQIELETLAYQKLQILQYLFWFYQSVSQTITDENSSQVQSIIKNPTIDALFVQYAGLLDECFKAPALVKLANRKPVLPFGEISFGEIDQSMTSSLAKYYNPIPLTAAKVLDIYSNDYDRVKAANEHAYSIFKALLQIHNTFSYWSKNKIDSYAFAYDSHEPHIALLLAYVKMQCLFDERFNQLVGGQSNFIFQDVLQLNRQSILPDTALVNLELAKNVNQFFLPKDSLFKAGKNAENKQIYYKSTQDLVLNAAKIEMLGSCVRHYRNGQRYAITSTNDAANAEWQANDAWLPFNDLSEAYSGLAFETKLLQHVSKKESEIIFEIEFINDIPPLPDNLAEKLQITVIQADESEKNLLVTTALVDTQLPKLLKIITKIEEDLSTLKLGINARLKLISPAKTDQDDDIFVVLYRYLLSETIGNLKVKLNQTSFVPSSVKTTSGLIDGSTSFTAFGTQSQAGSSFSIAHPYLPFAEKVTVKLNWAEALKSVVNITANNIPKTLAAGDFSSLTDFENDNKSSIKIRLNSDLSTKITSTIIGNGANKTIETNIPRILIIKDIELKASLSELVYEREKTETKFIEYFRNYFGIIRSLRLPFADKRRQKERVLERIKQIRMRIMRVRKNNLTAHLYPLGQLVVYKDDKLTLLPDYELLGYSSYQADLCIGLSNIVPGQSLSLLLDIADETAEQSEREAKITWHVLENEAFVALDASKIVDTTANFLQSGLVQLSLPEGATNHTELLFGKNMYWLVARCDTNYDVVANIKSIKVNGIAISRILDENNQETQVSVGAGTVEALFPKNANIKTISQNVASNGGRQAETDAHYRWRASQRLRHKKRAINQWDFEQLVLENFADIYKVKCFNHTFWDVNTQQLIAKPAHTLLTVLPHYRGNGAGANLQPAITLSKLNAIKNHILSRTSAFNQLQILNTQWDEIKIEAEVMLESGVLDLVFYKEQLNQDLKKFLAPWAFATDQEIADQQPIYVATLVDYIDELSYVHHIVQLKIYKNDLEIKDLITSTSPIHLITTTAEHSLIIKEYAS
jgi:hypothetical protein